MRINVYKKESKMLRQVRQDERRKHKQCRDEINHLQYKLGNACLSPLDKHRLVKEIAQFILRVRE